jgi:hypothetical protein
MMTSHTSTTGATTRRLGQLYVATILAVTGAGMLVAGIWAEAAPRSFARFVDFPYHEHFLHDLGAPSRSASAPPCWVRWPGGMPPRSP